MYVRITFYSSPRFLRGAGKSFPYRALQSDDSTHRCGKYRSDFPNRFGSIQGSVLKVQMMAEYGDLTSFKTETCEFAQVIYLRI